MKNILIPTDFSENSWNALNYTIELFKHETVNFYLLHIGDINQTDVVGNSFELTNNKIKIATIKLKLNGLMNRIDNLPKRQKHHFFAMQEYGNFISNIRKIVAKKK